MDGVIIDSTATHTEAWRRYLLEHGLDIERLGDRMLGKHNADLVRDFFGPETPHENVIRHGAMKERLYREMMAPIFFDKLVPGVTRFIQRNRTIPMGIATNAEPPNIDFVLDRAGLREFVQVIVNGDEVPRPKPAPDIYLRAAELLGVNPSDCIVFEDSLTGVEAGRAAGMRVVGLTTTLQKLEGVDLTIRDFDDPALSQWLQASITLA